MTPARFAALVLARLAAIVALLVSKGWPALSDWWTAQLGRFMSAQVRAFVGRIGRRGGKSSTAVVFSVAFALVYAGLGLVPPADIGWVIFVSARRDEAQSRLRGVEAVLRALGVAFSPADGDAITIDGTNIGFRVLTCNVASVSGWTAILVIADEVAKWLNSETGQNPGAEVLAALRPTMATQPFARIMLLSSPVGSLDAHALAFDLGDTDLQIVAHAPTWIANPTISEADTRGLEPNARLRLREYAAVPQGALTACFDLDTIDAAMARKVPPSYRAAESVLVYDASRGGDAWTFALARWRAPGPDASKDAIPLLEVSLVAEVPNARDSGGAVNYLVGTCKTFHVRDIFGDQYEAGALGSRWRSSDLRFREMTWTASSKSDAVDRLDRRLRDGSIVIPNDPALRKQLAEYTERISRSGSLVYGGSGRHDDWAAVILTLSMADLAGELPDDPENPRPVPQVFPPLELPPPGFHGVHVSAAEFMGTAETSAYGLPGLAASLARNLH